VAAAKKNETTDLLDELDSDNAFSTEIDLLDELENEGDAENWNPEGPAGIQGTVLSRSLTTSTYHDDEVHVVTIKEKDTGKTVRITGYRGVLNREIKDQNPQPGDFFAVKYYGLKQVKSGKWAGKDFHHYRVGVRKAPSAA